MGGEIWDARRKSQSTEIAPVVASVLLVQVKIWSNVSVCLLQRLHRSWLGVRLCSSESVELDGWPVDEMEGGWCPVFALSYVDAKLSVLGAVSEIDVDFAAVRCAVDEQVGSSSGWENWLSGRGAACHAVMCKGA
jgi:hypothetical protein